MRRIPLSGRRWFAVALVLLAAVVAAGTVVAGQFRSPDPKEFERDLASGRSMRIADIAAADGRPAHGVFAETTEGGLVCLFDAASATALQRGGGCNDADDPLGGAAVSASLSYEGGPAIEGVKDARIIGLASARAQSVRIEMTDGSSRSVLLRATRLGGDAFRAFGFRIAGRDLARGIGPAAVVAYDAAGNELGRQPTGIG